MSNKFKCVEFWPIKSIVKIMPIIDFQPRGFRISKVNYFFKTPFKQLKIQEGGYQIYLTLKGALKLKVDLQESEIGYKKM